MNSMDPQFDPRGAFRRRGHRRGFGPGPGAGPDAPPFAGPVDDERPGPHGHRHPGRRGPRPPFPPGFGPGFGGRPGRPGFGPGPRGRGRGRARGDIRAAVLALVAEQPRHGYEIIQEIAERSGGVWRPSPGSVYPTLSQLQDEGLVSVEKADGRRVVHLTDAGTAYVAEHRAELDAVWESVGKDADDPAVTLWEQLGQLHAAAHQVASAGSPEQVASATETLTEARKALYKLLAE